MRFPFAFLAVLCTACIIRTAAPPSTGPGSAPAPAPAQPSGALEAANAHIAGLPRVDLLGGASVGAFRVNGETQKVEATNVPVSGQPFAQALRLAIKEPSSHEYAVQLQAPTTAAVTEGDAILATFFLRTEKSDEGTLGETEFVFELGQAPYSKSIQYPIQAGGAWTKVQVRFRAAQSFAPGAASMIFRLGYDPETIELGGVLVEDFGKTVAVTTLPSTQLADRRRERDASAAAKAAAAAPAAVVEGGELRIDVDAAHVIRRISPFVYGINSQKDDDGLGITVKRMGGNRQTGYNWENNASNAGRDYRHQSDEWSCTAMGYRDCSVPGAQFVDFATANRKNAVESTVTIPLVDFVTADKSGSVSEADKAPSKRWNRSFLQKDTKKDGPYAQAPDLNDGKVYQDELVNFLVEKLGTADKGGIKFYSLDNEPSLWPSTHPRIHPEKTTYREMITRSEAAALAITKLDPKAIVLGAVAYGWGEYKTLGDAPDAKEHNAKYGTYLDFFLASMKALEAEHHRRLVHVLDVHWYPEARGSKRITDDDVTPKTVAARLQAPRSLWDPTYVEKSFIAGELKGPVRLIPWLRERIAERYPGTELGITEYDYGTPDHISGGLAQVDVLGALGREGVFLANYWGNGPGNGPLPGYIKAAFKLFRNYDGKGGTFGDTAVAAAPADQNKASVYAASDSRRPGLLTVIVINKDLRSTFAGGIDIKGGKTYETAAAYAIDASGPEVRARPAVEIKNNRITYRLPPLSATLFVCQGS